VELSTHFLENINKVCQQSVYLESPLFNIIVVTLTYENGFKRTYSTTVPVSKAQLTADLKKALGVKRLSVCSFTEHCVYIYFKAPLGVTLDFVTQYKSLVKGWICGLGLFRGYDVGTAQIAG
jgi:hypothetical protein